MMDRTEIINEIFTKLLHLNKEVYQRTGTAPLLAVYLRPTLSSFLVGSINSLPLPLPFRELEFNQRNTIAGYPCYVLSTAHEDEHEPYIIAQIH